MKKLALLGFVFLLGAQGEGKYDKAADYSARHDGLSVLVIIDGKIVYERYDNGHSRDKPVHLYSGTKGFWSAGCAAMVEDRVFTLDERISDTITEWKDDDRKRRITVRHLLQLNSGLQHDIPMLQGFQGKAKDKYKHAVGLKPVARPGVWFSYGPGHYYVLGEFMKRKRPGSL